MVLGRGLHPPSKAAEGRWIMEISRFLPRCSMQPVFPIAKVSVRLSVRLSVRHSVKCDKTKAPSEKKFNYD